MSTTTIHKYGTDDGWHGVIEEGGQFPPEMDRYHLYIGLFCPFAHRVNLVRCIKGLQDILPLSIVRPFPKDGGGWRFPATNDEYPGATVDHLFGSEFLSEVYFRDDKEYKGKFSVPLLWDKKAGRIVSTESAEMLTWLPTAFNAHLPPTLAAIDLHPIVLHPVLKNLLSWVHSSINIGVYKAGFARTQADYESGCTELFAALNQLEKLLASVSTDGPFILSSELTALDINVFVTLVRFDVVYVQHFKVNLGTVRHDYPLLNNWLKGMWRVEACRETTNWRHIKESYTRCHGDINPLGITPLGPWPEIEEGYESDWRKLRQGRVKHPAVLEAAVKMSLH